MANNKSSKHNTKQQPFASMALSRAKESLSSFRAYVKRTPAAKVLIIFALFAVVMYGPYVARGGLTYDDWSVSRLGHGGCAGFTESFRCYWPSYAHRPLADVYYSVTTNLFHDNAAGYIIVGVSLWLSAVLLLFKVFLKRFGLGFATVFLFIGAVPSVSSTIIFSPAMQSVGALSFLVWAVSFYLLDASIDSKNRRKLWLSYVLMLVSLLFYESSLPLFGLSVLWAHAVHPKALKRSYISDYVKKYVVPLFTVMLMLIFYQKVIIVHVWSNVDKLSKFLIFNNNVDVIDFGFRIVTSVIYIFTVGLASFMARAVARLHLYSLKTLINFLVIAGLIAAGLYVARKSSTSVKARKNLHMLYLLPTVLGIAGVHYVALQPPTFIGYLNRAMVSASIVVALAAAIAWQRYAYGRKVFAILLIGVFIAYNTSFLIQRNNFIETRRTQEDIQSDILPKLAKLKQRPVFVLAYLPTYLPHNFNNETIFSDEVLDWSNYLYVKTGDVEIKGISVSKARVERKEFSIKDGTLIAMGVKVPMQQLYFYHSGDKTLVPVESEAQLQDILDKAPQVLAPASADGEMRESIRAWLATY